MGKMNLEKLAEMTMNGFRDLGDSLRSELRREFRTEINRLDQKINLRFDDLSNRIDDLALNKVSWPEHKKLMHRVDRLEGI